MPWRSFLAALFACGCLYTDPINQRPVIDQMAASPQPTRYDKRVTVTFYVYDPDGDDWSADARVLESTNYQADRQEVEFLPSGPGPYTVVVSATDSLGANSGERRIVVDVPNMVPRITPPDGLGADTAPMADGRYALGTTFTIPPPKQIDDEDRDLSAEFWVNGTKLDGDTFRALTAGTYTVTFKATDSRGTEGSATLDVLVAEDGWPCITATSPDANTQLFLTAVDETRRLLVTRVDDDLNPWPPDSHGGHAYFQWFIDSEGDFREIPNWTESYYDLDGSGHSAGDLVKVRVVVSDDDPTHVPMCNSNVDACPSLSCAQWLTWNLEFFQ